MADRVARARWLLAPLAALALIVGGYMWINGGERLRGSAFTTDASARVGQVFSVGVGLSTSGGGKVTLVRAKVAPATPQLRTQVTATSSARGLGSYVGDLPFETVPVRGVKVERPGLESGVRLRQWLVVSFVADAAGAYMFDAVDVTYRSGLRERTARIAVPVRFVAT